MNSTNPNEGSYLNRYINELYRQPQGFVKMSMKRMNHNSFVVWSLVAVLLHSQCFNVKGSDPCRTYISFPDLEKRDINFTISPTERALSDVYIDSADDWFGEEGYDVATSPPMADAGRCGTTYPMWIKGKLPFKDEKILKACLVDVGDDCSKSVQVRVKACENLHVYKLSNAPVFEAAYCVGLTDPNKPVSKYTVKPDVRVDVVTDTKHFDHFEFKCIFTKSTDTLLYSIQWFVNGGYLTSFPPAEWTPQISDNAALTETILTEKGYKSPGFDLQCTVRSSLGIGFPAGYGILSDKSFIGIRLPPGPVTVLEGEEANIDLKLSAPFGCAGRTRGCRLDVFALARDSPGSCDPSAFVQSKCGVTFGSIWKEAKTMTIKGEVTKGYNAKETRMKLFLSTAEHVQTHPYWSNYDIGSITVIVKKVRAKATQTFCYANQDPHMKTYDNLRYEFQDHDGVFILYKHSKLEIEVQMKLQACIFGIPGARCPCGLAVRTGRTVYRIDSCAGTPAKIGFADCSDGRDLLKVQVKGTVYKIHLPTGSTVDLTLNPRKKFFNINLHPSSDDWDMVSGLCGTFNGDEHDDVGADKFTKWRAQLDLFNDNHFRLLKYWQSTFGLCVCDVLTKNPSSLDSSVSCSRTDPKLCTFDKRFRERLNRECYTETGRRRRSIFHARVDRYRRDVGSPGEVQTWTTENATIFCDSFFNKSKTAILCADIPGMANILDENRKNCVLDIMATGGTTFAIDALESAKSLCMNEVELNSTLQEEPEPGVPSTYEALLEVTCENECSGRGTCVTGECQCEEGFASSDCSRDKSVPPRILGMDWDGHCDVATETCNETALIGDYFDEFGQIRCRFVPFTIFSNDSQSKDPAKESAPMVESFSEAICVLPTSRQKRSATPTIPTDSMVASGYKISIANYGDVFSEESTLVLYNSQCQSCNVSGHLVACTFTSKSCIVGSQCVQHGETHPENPCFTCDASMPTRTWLRKSDASCTSPEDESKLWIIGAVVGGLVLAAVVIGLACFLLKKGKSRKVVDTPRGSAFLHVQ